MEPFDTTKIAELLCDPETIRLAYPMLEHLSDEECIRVFCGCGKMISEEFSIIVRSVFDCIPEIGKRQFYWDYNKLKPAYDKGDIFRRNPHGIPDSHELTEKIRKKIKNAGIREL